MRNQHIIRPDGRELPVRGYKKSRRRKEYDNFHGGRIAKNLPPRVDLRPFMTEVESQGDTNSCVANAVAGAYEYLLKRHLGDKAYDVSRLFVYYNSRDLDEDYEDGIEDLGAEIELAIEGLKEYGVCPEDVWPFEEDNVNEEPNDESYEIAAHFLVEDTQLVPTDLNSWREALAEGHPIIFGLSLYDSFDRHRKKGLVPQPTKKERSREDHSGHAMLCVGYSDTDQVFIVRNSWGADWGDEGYCYIPYNYVLNPDYNDGDSWIIRQLENFEIDEQMWGDEESVLVDYDTEFSEMSDEDYEEMLDEMGDYPLELRLGTLFLAAAWEDDDLTDEEYDAVAAALEDPLEALGSDLSAKKILKRADELVDDEEFLEETAELFDEWLSVGMLARILRDMREITQSDEDEEGENEDEQDFIDWLVDYWQVSPDGEDLTEE